MQEGLTQLTSSFVQLDDNIVKTPVALLPSLRTTPADDQAAARQTIAALAEVADNGACAISALVDAEAGNLYVASTGDCRAVAGWEKDGVWRCDVLSEDQMGENPREVER
jgi:pyruvate dehydrogenase phosphatase